ncbi:MAG: hypothetical protein ACFFBT_15780 [Promethearchaeota archaeon]
MVIYCPSFAIDCFNSSDCLRTDSRCDCWKTINYKMLAFIPELGG